MSRRIDWRKPLSVFLVAGVASAVQLATTATPSSADTYASSSGSRVAVAPAKAKQATAIAAGYLHTCAITTQGAALCWGYNAYGQLGNNTVTDSAEPVAVSRLGSSVKAISAGYMHTCALTNKGVAKCWGYNAYGQLGDNSLVNSAKPVPVYGLGQDLRAISGGYYHTCALTRARIVKCWGNNASGQLGDGSTTSSSKPVRVKGLGKGVQAISAAYTHTCAIIESGAVKCWGSNGYGQLGDNTTTNSSTPVAVVGLGTHVKSVRAGYISTCAVTRKAAAKCWGYNGDGQLGDNSTTNSPRPVGVYGLDSKVRSIRTAVSHGCAVTSSGVTKCWGSNPYGELGDNTTTSSLRPVRVYNLTNVLTISVGYLHTCAITARQVVKCWGYNGYGELGSGTTVNSPKPVRVAGF